MHEEQTTRGQFHDVILLEDRVISVARTTFARRRLPRRAETLRIIRELMPNGLIPEIQGVTPDSITMSRLPGAPLDSGTPLPPEAFESIVNDLTELLETMSRIDPGRASMLGIEKSPANRWSAFADDVQSTLFPLMSETGRTRATRELDRVLAVPVHSHALVHGDLGGENLLFTTISHIPHLTGVVDWDEAHIGDPAEDLASVAATFDAEIIHRIVDRLDLGDDILDRCEAIRGTFALQQAQSAYWDGDIDEMDDGLAAYITPQ